MYHDVGPDTHADLLPHSSIVFLYSLVAKQPALTAPVSTYLHPNLDVPSDPKIPRLPLDERLARTLIRMDQVNIWFDEYNADLDQEIQKAQDEANRPVCGSEWTGTVEDNIEAEMQGRGPTVVQVVLSF